MTKKKSLLIAAVVVIAVTAAVVAVKMVRLKADLDRLQTAGPVAGASPGQGASIPLKPGERLEIVRSGGFVDRVAGLWNSLLGLPPDNGKLRVIRGVAPAKGTPPPSSPTPDGWQVCGRTLSPSAGRKFIFGIKNCESNMEGGSCGYWIYDSAGIGQFMDWDIMIENDYCYFDHFTPPELDIQDLSFITGLIKETGKPLLDCITTDYCGSLDDASYRRLTSPLKSPALDSGRPKPRAAPAGSTGGSGQNL